MRQWIAAANRQCGKVLILATIVTAVLPGRGTAQDDIPPPTPLPRNVIAPMVPYEEGIAGIFARDAIRPKADAPLATGPRLRPDSLSGSGAPVLPRPQSDGAPPR